MKPLAHHLMYTYRRSPDEPLPKGWLDAIYDDVSSPSWVFSVLDETVLYHLIVPESCEAELPEKGLLAKGIWGAVHELKGDTWEYSKGIEATSRARAAIALTLGKHPLFFLDGGNAL